MRPTRTITRPETGRATAEEKPYLFLVFRCDQPLEPGARFALDGVDVVEIGRADRLTASRAAERGATVLRIGLPDACMSWRHARLEKVLASWTLRDLGSKNGTLVDGLRTARAQIEDGALIELGYSFLLFRKLAQGSSREVLDGGERSRASQGLRTLSPRFAADLERLELVARSRMAILLYGETGTGKEVLAAAIHELSGRTGRFVPVNCGALPATLVESELFGYRKGAFSGAAENRTGLIRSSDGGTLLLDEVGDLLLPAQASLLRVLQEEEVLSVGATRSVKVDLRVVAATHRDLVALAAEDRFRRDLLARLSGFILQLPPLRERREDLGLLSAAILRKHAGATAQRLGFTPEAARALLLYEWPLNIRELEKCLSGAAILARGGRIDLEHLPSGIRTATRLPAPSDSLEDASIPPVREKDRRRREELVASLREHDGNVTAVARAAGKARSQIQRWLRRYRLKPSSFRR